MAFSISTQGLSLIMEHEGFLPSPRRLPSGGFVVGYGHVREFDPGEPVTREEAELLLIDDLEPVADSVNDTVAHPLTQAQFDALVSFAFSIGVTAFQSSQVLRRVNAGDIIAAACLIDAWRKTEVSGKLQAAPALIRRRAVEKAMLLCGVACDPAPSAFLQPRLDHAAAVLGAPIKYEPTPEVGAVAAQTFETASPRSGEELLLTEVVTHDGMETGAAHRLPTSATAHSVNHAREALRRAHSETPPAGFEHAASQWRRKAEALSASAASWVNAFKNPNKA